jgi:hypothetical protein
VDQGLDAPVGLLVQGAKRLPRLIGLQRAAVDVQGVAAAGQTTIIEAGTADLPRLGFDVAVFLALAARFERCEGKKGKNAAHPRRERWGMMPGRRLGELASHLGSVTDRAENWPEITAT